MATRTFHPLPKRPNFASVPGSSGSSSSQRHSHLQQQQQQQQHQQYGHSSSVHSSVAHTPSPSNRPHPAVVHQAVQPTHLSNSQPIHPPSAANPSTQSQPQIPLKPVYLPPPLLQTSSLLGSQIQLDKSFHLSSATYSGTSLACERFREYIISTWNDGAPVLDPYLFDFGQVEGQITLYKYEDILCDSEEYERLEMNLTSSSVHPLSAPLSPEIRAGFLRALRERVLYIMCRAHDKHGGPPIPKAVKCSSTSFLLVPPQLFEVDDWASAWTSGLKRPLLKVSLSLHLLQGSITAVHVLCIPALSNLHVPSALYPLEPQRRIRLLPHNTPALFISHYKPEKESPNRLVALQEEFRKCLSPGWCSAADNCDKLVRVWIPVAPNDEHASSTKESVGVECIYPLSHILVEASQGPSQTSTKVASLALRAASKYDTSLRLEKRVQEITAFIDGVVKERERIRMDMIHGARGETPRTPGSSSGDNNSKGAGSGSRPPKRRRLATLGKEPSLVSSSSGGFEKYSSRTKNPEQRYERDQESASDLTVPLPMDRTTEPMVQTPKTPPISDQDQPPNPLSSNFATPTQSQALAHSRTSANSWSDLDFGLDMGSKRPISHTTGRGNDDVATFPAHRRRVSDNEGESFDITDDDFNFFEGPGRVSPTHNTPLDLMGLGGTSFIAPASMMDDQQTENIENEQVEDAIGLESVSTSDGQVEEDEVHTPEETLPLYAARGRARASTVTGKVLDGAGIFDALDFGGKWDLGATILALEDELRPSVVELDEPPNDSTLGWRKQYDKMTDPRIGIVKLLGNKKNGVMLSDAVSCSKRTRDGETKGPSWEVKTADCGDAICSRSGELWTRPVGVEDIEIDQEEEEESDDETVFNESEVEDLTGDNATKEIEQYSTPLSEADLSSLPQGPDLLHSCFLYDNLVARAQPHSVTFPPLMSDSPDGLQDNLLTGQAVSAPTPVSPGATSVDRIKSLESVANVMAQEVVAWVEFFAHRVLDESEDCIDYGDIAQIEQLVKVASLGDKLSIEAISSASLASDQGTSSSDSPPDCSPKLQRTPRILIGQSQTQELLGILPSSLTYWDKLGLAPKNGPKNIRMFLVRSASWSAPCDNNNEWLQRFQDVYQGRLFGQAVVGQGHDVVNGTLHVTRESFKKPIVSLVESLPSQSPDDFTVIFISFPNTLASLDCSTFRQLLLFFQKMKSQMPMLLFQLIPDHLTVYILRYPDSRHGGMDHIACNVYDRLLRPIERPAPSRFRLTPDLGGLREYFQAPAFTLVDPKPSFQMSPAFRYSLDVTERHRILHFAYQLSECGRWLVATGIDQTGQATDVKLWALGEGGDDGDSHRFQDIIERVWTFVIDFAKKADIEWRIAIVRVGTMGDSELKAWSEHVSVFLTEESHRASFVAEMHVSLLSFQTKVPWFFNLSSFRKPTANTGSATLNNKQLVYTDISSTTYAAEIFPGLHADLCADSDAAFRHFVDSPYKASVPSEYNQISQPLLSTALVRIPLEYPISPTSISTQLVHLLHTISSPKSCMRKSLQGHMKDLVESLYDLQILACLRWGEVGKQLALPLHLAALHSVLKCLPVFSETSSPSSPSS